MTVLLTRASIGFICLLAACGSNRSPETTPAAPAPPAAALPPNAGPACTLSKECGAGQKCMRIGNDAGHCFDSPAKNCDAPECECFESDPCRPNALGRCVGYETGVVICGT